MKASSLTESVSVSISQYHLWSNVGDKSNLFLLMRILLSYIYSALVQISSPELIPTLKVGYKCNSGFTLNIGSGSGLCKFCLLMTGIWCLIHWRSQHPGKTWMKGAHYPSPTSHHTKHHSYNSCTKPLYGCS